MIVFPKNVFSSLIENFSAKMRKFLYLEKLEKIMKKESILKKRFHPLKRHLYQNGKAENMPVLAGRLVQYTRGTAAL